MADQDFYPIRNAPNVADLKEFQAVLNRYGSLAQACRFLVKINLPKNPPKIALASNLLRDLTFLCESAELPGRAFNIADARYYGPSFKYPTQSIYTDLTLNFIIRDRLLEKEFFDDWMQIINPNNSYNFEYKTNYSTTIDIIQYSAVEDPDNKGENRRGSRPIYKITCVDAWPINVNPMQTVWGEDNFHRLSVQFAYTDWRRSKDPLAGKFKLIESGNLTEGSKLGSADDPINVILS
mgnify:CR=1 FL=1